MTQLQTNQQPQTVLTSTVRITLDKNTCIATSHTLDAVARALEVRAQIKMLTKQLDADKAIIQAQMGEHTKLVDNTGRELATWSYNKDSERVDAKVLKIKYPEIYNDIAELVAGSRVFNFAK